MAGVAAGGMFGSLARAQYAALAAMRWRMFRNGMRSTRGALEASASGAITLLYACMGLGLAFGLGAAAYQAAAHDQSPVLSLLFWMVFFVWQGMPVMVASFQQQFELNGVLRFPLGFGSFYLLHIVFGLIDISTITGSLCCVGMWAGISLARPDLTARAALMLLIFAVFNIFLVRAVFAWIDRWLAQRRTREIVTALFLCTILAINFFNPAFRDNPGRAWITPAARAKIVRYMHAVNTVQGWLPPGLAARGMTREADLPASLALLGLYMVGAGGMLGFRLGGEFRGESFGEAPARKKEEKRSTEWLLDGSGPIAAVLEKELRTLMRAMPLLYGVATPLLMVFVFSGLFKHRGASGFASMPWGLLLCLAYAVVGFTQLLYNNLGTEGAGIQVLFLSPTPVRTVIVAKNLFHGGLFILDAVLVCIIASLRYGAPTLTAIAACVAWVVFALPVNMAAGNLFSITMPYRINMGRLSRQKGSQANALLSMAVQLGTLLVGGGVFAMSAYFNRLWLAVAVLLGLAIAAVFAWYRVLARVDVLAMQRRESLIEALVRTE